MDYLNEEDFEESEFDLETYEDRINRSRQEALRMVETMNLPNTISISSNSFKGLGSSISRKAKRVLDVLAETYAEKLPCLIGIALREYHFAVCSGACYCMAIGSNPSICTPEGYAEMEGRASAMYNGLIDLQEHLEQTTFRIGTPILERVSSEILLDCIAIYWLSQASELNQKGEYFEAQNWIYEGLDALIFSNGVTMWDAATEFGHEENSQSEKVSAARSILARIGANARHAEHRSMKADVFSWLDANMANFKSMDSAAEAIAGVIVPTKFRATRAWVGEWKKVRSAGTP